MKRILCAVMFLLSVPAAPAADPVADPVARIEVAGAIDPVTAEFVVRGIERAESEGAALVLLQLDTPGGFGASMEAIIARMLRSRVPVVVWVGPGGAKAASAGFFVLLAADVAAMAPGSATGAAHPLLAVGGFPVDGGEAGKTLSDKVTSNATAYLRSIVTRRGRSPEEAEKGVTESKSFTEAEALAAGLIDLVAGSEAELLGALEGRRVRMFSGEERVLATAGAAVVRYEMTWRERALAAVSQPNLALLLGLVGVILLYFEFSNPGFIVPGVVGGICVLLAVLGLSLLPINHVGVLLLLLAVGLLVAEVKVGGFGVLGIGGIVSMVMGMMMLIDSPDPAVRIGLYTALALALPFAVISLILLVALIRSLGQRAATGDEGMVGLEGVADTAIGAAGRVLVRGEYWAARAEAPIAAGKRVRVVGVDHLTLTVEETTDGGD